MEGIFETGASNLAWVIANYEAHCYSVNQGRRIKGFEGARAPPEHGSAPFHCQKHPLKMKGKLDETSFQTDTQQSYGGFDVHIRLTYICVKQL